MVRLVCAVLLLAVATAAAPDSRIVGGIPTSVENFPSIVQVQTSFVGVWRQTCGGCILTSRFILSSAGCFIGPDFNHRRRRVIAGSSIRNTGGQVSGVLNVVQHPSWHEGVNLEGDIAVIELVMPLQFTNVVQQSRILGQGAFIPDNMLAVNVGWGVTLAEEFPSLFSNVVKKADVITVNNQWCTQIYANLSPIPFTVTSNMLCATSLAPATGNACIGDRGGPLFINDITVAIVSWGLSCTNSTIPTVHTAIPSYTNWIVGNVN